MSVDKDLGELAPHFKDDEFLRKDAKYASSQEPRLEDALARLRGAIEQSGVERSAALLKLAAEVEQRAFSYVRTIINNIRASRALYFGGGEDFRAQDRLKASDSLRRAAHNALIDTLNALLRNSLKDGIEGARPLAERLAGHQNDADHRVRITDAALGYVYRQVLQEMERKEEE